MMINSKEDILTLLEQNKDQLFAFGVSSLGLFGSFQSGNFSDDSDIDFVIEFRKGMKSYNNFIQLVYFLEDLLGRKVEVLTPNSVSPYIKPHIERNIEYVPLAS